jgi:hypothetical protein
MRFAALAWTHGGGIPGAVGLAATAIYAGQADIVVVYRAMSEDDHARLQVAVTQDDTPAQFLVNGIDMTLQRCAMRSQRMIEADGLPRNAGNHCPRRLSPCAEQSKCLCLCLCLWDGARSRTLRGLAPDCRALSPL